MPYYLYSITFPNGKLYFGITFSPSRRFSAHKASARCGSTKQKVFNAIRKYGEDNLIFKTLVKGNEQYIRELEKKAIAFFNTRNHLYGYNQAEGGEISPVAGIGHSEASKLKMSLSQKKRTRTEAEILKMSASLKGRVITDEAKEKIRQKQKQFWASKETRLTEETLQRLNLIRTYLMQNLSSKEIQILIGLGKCRTNALIRIIKNEGSVNN